MATEPSHATRSREQTNSPPRFAAPKGSMAATFADAQTHGAPIAADFPGDEARNILTETIAIVDLLVGGFDDATARTGAGVCEMLLRKPATYGRALDGISRMLRLADFHVACSMGEGLGAA